MIPRHMMTAEVDIEYTGETTLDRYNRPVAASEPTVVTLSAYYRAGRTSVNVSGGDTVEADMRVFLQPNVDLTGVEAVVVEGRRYKVDGQPQPHWHPSRKKVMYQVLALRRGTSEVG